MMSLFARTRQGTPFWQRIFAHEGDDIFKAEKVAAVNKDL